jgi:hypothetical protein
VAAHLGRPQQQLHAQTAAQGGGGPRAVRDARVADGKPALSASWLRRYVALPAEHGAWFFLLGPLAVGYVAGGTWRVTSSYLLVAALAAFLIRQPLTLAVKALTGRRSRDVLPAAVFWTLIYGAVCALHVLGLVLRGFGYLLWLALPALPVFAWYLWLVARRAERRRWLVEVAGAGNLALAAPAAMWIGLGRPDPAGWTLWLLTWSHSIAAIAQTYLRLEQRGLREMPPPGRRLRGGAVPLGFAWASVAAVSALSLAGALPRWTFAAFLVQALETTRTVARPEPRLKPRQIGLRQLAVSVAFTVLLAWAWIR